MKKEKKDRKDENEGISKRGYKSVGGYMNVFAKRKYEKDKSKERKRK